MNLASFLLKQQKRCGVTCWSYLTLVFLVIIAHGHIAALPYSFIPIIMTSMADVFNSLFSHRWRFGVSLLMCCLLNMEGEDAPSLWPKHKLLKLIGC